MKRKRIWKIRMVKDYENAKNHLIVGRVIDENPTRIIIEGRSYHFGKNVGRTKDIARGDCGTRIIPWCRIELANELPDDFDYYSAELEQRKKKGVVLTDGANECIIYADLGKPSD
ncbi:MAG: hypothetical protein JXA52_08050 [Planctomycetes bacterium]|nr:hypothetical protein [Planctomycetota bacterium]